jgi:hypothetical protein
MLRAQHSYGVSTVNRQSIGNRMSFRIIKSNTSGKKILRRPAAPGLRWARPRNAPQPGALAAVARTATFNIQSRTLNIEVPIDFV